MLLKNLKVVLIPSNASHVKKFAVPNIIWLGTLLFLMGSAVLLGLLIWQFKHKIVDSQRIATLKKENTILERKMDQFGGQMSELHAAINNYQDDRDRILRVADYLNVFESDSVQLDIPRDQIDQELLIQQVDKLIGISRAQEQRLQEIMTSLEQHPDIWDHTPSILPCNGLMIGPGFEKIRDPFTGKIRMHEGLDISAPIGTPIVASADGKVSYVGQSERYGWVVEIDHGYGYKTAYGHCSVVRAKKGEEVKRGQVIALVGNTGRSTGPHLHYEVKVNNKKVDPMKYVLK